MINMRYFMRKHEWGKIENILTSSAFAFDQYFDEKLFFTGICGETKEEIISEIVRRIGEQKLLPRTFYNEIIAREAASPTDFGYKTALPHPKRPMGDSTFASVAVLASPFFWSSQKVRLVIIVSPEKGAIKKIRDFYQSVMAFILDKDKINDFLDEPTFGRLRKLFSSVYVQD